MSDSRPLVAVVPVALTDGAQLEALAQTLVALFTHLPGAPLIVAGGSDSEPALLDQVAHAAAELDGELVRSPGATVLAINAALTAATEGGADVLLVGQDVVVDDAPWLGRLQARLDTQGRPAAVVGGRIAHPDGILAEAGLYFSLLLREWQPRLRYAPANLPAALKPVRCPVGTSLQLIRHETLVQLGGFDPELTVEHANVDFALRAFSAGLECVYEPSVLARRSGLAVAGDDLAPALRRAFERSTRALWTKHREMDLTPWIPETL